MLSASRSSSLFSFTTKNFIPLSTFLSSSVRFHSCSSSSNNNNSNTTINDNNNEQQQPPHKIISPADLARRLARSGTKNNKDHHHDDQEQQLTPRKSKDGSSPSSSSSQPMSGVKRETLRLYRSLLKVTKAPKPTSNIDVDASSDEKEQNVNRIRMTPKKEPDSKSGKYLVKKFEMNPEQLYIQKQFGENKNIPRKNIDKIQWHVHHGQTKLEELEKLKKYRTGFKVMTFG